MALGVYIIAPDAMTWIAREDGVLEYGSVVLYLVAAGLFTDVARRKAATAFWAWRSSSA